MTGRWLSEHRRLLATMGLIVLLVVVAPVALGGGSSAAQRSSRPPPAAAALVATRARLVAEQGQVKQLQTLSLKQSVEISSLKARLQALRRPHRHRHHRR
jgi:hypothetical protein